MAREKLSPLRLHRVRRRLAIQRGTWRKPKRSSPKRGGARTGAASWRCPSLRWRMRGERCWPRAEKAVMYSRVMRMRRPGRYAGRSLF